jgi:hypothetical protein
MRKRRRETVGETQRGTEAGVLWMGAQRAVAEGFCCTFVGVTDNEGMRQQGTGRNPLFAKRWFADEVIIICVRWYLRFRLSYRDLASVAAELGIAAAPSTILRWMIRSSDVGLPSRW